MNKERQLYFDKLRFGEAMAIMVLKNDNGVLIDNDFLSDTARKQLNDLKERISRIINKKDRQLLLDFRNSNSGSREIIENYFIYSVHSSEKKDICSSLFKAALFTLPVFEEFCTILKDYIDTQKKLTDGRESKKWN